MSATQKPHDAPQAVEAKDVALRSETPATADPGPTVAQSEAAGIMQVITRMALDPSADPERIGKFMDMYERAQDRSALIAYNEAMRDMQPKLPIIDRKGRIVITDKNDRSRVIQSTGYAKFEDIMEAIQPILYDHGFSVTFATDTAMDGKIVVRSEVRHNVGHVERNTITLPYDTSGSKNNVQGIGSAISYGKRYGLVAALNIITRGEDDDGQSADSTATINQGQVAEIRRQIEVAGVTEESFLSWASAAAKVEIGTVEDVPAAFFDKAVKALGNFKKQPARA